MRRLSMFLPPTLALALAGLPLGTSFPATSGSTARCQPRPHPRPAGIYVASCAASPAASALPRASASPPSDLAPTPAGQPCSGNMEAVRLRRS
jgi:hypothetical protein